MKRASSNSDTPAAIANGWVVSDDSDTDLRTRGLVTHEGGVAKPAGGERWEALPPQHVHTDARDSQNMRCGSQSGS